MEGRFAGGDVEHPGGSVLTEQRALRAAQHFQLIDVEQVEHGHARATKIDVVQIDADAAFQAVAGRVVTQAADRDARLAGVNVGHVGARY
ncbi:hypothetical protein D3C76_1486760 [compost metagenome]